MKPFLRTPLSLGFSAVLALALLGLGCGSQAATATASTAAATPAPLPPLEVHSVNTLLATLPAAEIPPLNETEAMTLAAFPLSCLDHPQAQPGAGRGGSPAPLAASARPSPSGAPAAPRPSGPAAYLWESAGPTHLLAGYDRERSFYGCYDWHSAVNSTWTLVTILKRYPNIPVAALIREKLNDHLGKRNLAGELAFFQRSKSFERPYGQAWLLKLYADLLSWKDPDAQKWAANMAPLAQFFSQDLVTYFKTLPTPIRQGVHPNSAFDMDLMLPYTEVAHDTALRQTIQETSLRFYLHDEQCPTGYEPEGVSFLSPCLVEGALMSRLLGGGPYLAWFDQFMPPVYSHAFRPLLAPFDASQMKPDQMAGQSHLIGLAFSRADALLTIAAALPPNDPRVPVFRRLAAIHAIQGYKTMDKAGYLETHWIATYALMYELAAVHGGISGTAVAAR